MTENEARREKAETENEVSRVEAPERGDEELLRIAWNLILYLTD